ncbi:40S ribosomal protein S5-1 [Hordeum vulgare]|nr:40S ribosomal protein S5-1 [Hordeum vulgare]
MAASSSSKDKFFDNVINPYLREVVQHSEAIQMREGVLHIRDVQGPKGTGSVEARFEAMEREVFRCKGMVERGLNANHLMIADYIRDLKVDGKSMKDIVFSLNEQINFLHSQIHGLQSQVFEYEARFKDDEPPSQRPNTAEERYHFIKTNTNSSRHAKDLRHLPGGKVQSSSPRPGKAPPRHA